MSLHRRPEVWGVLNVTPDSFSDGGDYFALDRAVTRAHDMMSQGASVIDVGGESTRPGASRVDVESEQARVLPVITELTTQGIPVSIDTMWADTALKARAAGATIINDVSGGMADEKMLPMMALEGCNVVLMHWRAHSQEMDSVAVYDDVVNEVREALAQRVAAALAVGIAAENIILDPGLGFAKISQHNWELLAQLEEAIPAGYRVLVGASRKRFLGELLPEGHEVQERDASTAHLGVLLAEKGVGVLRVHNVAAQTHALDVWQAFQQGGLRG